MINLGNDRSRRVASGDLQLELRAAQRIQPDISFIEEDKGRGTKGRGQAKMGRGKAKSSR